MTHDPSRDNEAESSATLLVAAKGGDANALNRLLQRCLPRLRRWARGRLPQYARDMSDTEDLVQDVVLKTLHRIDDFEPKHQAALDAYLRQALWNRIRDELRRTARVPNTAGLPDDLTSRLPSPLEQAIGHEALNRYERGLQQLKPHERHAVIARLELGYSHQELADALGVPSWDAARKTFQRAMVRLARLMRDE